MHRIKKLIADWRAEQRRKRELYRELDSLTDYGLLNRILGIEPSPLSLTGYRRVRAIDPSYRKTQPEPRINIGGSAAQ